MSRKPTPHQMAVSYINLLETQVRELLRSFENTGGLSDEYMNALARLRGMVPVHDNPDLPEPIHMVRTIVDT